MNTSVLPPSGGDESRAGAIIAAQVITTSIALALVCLRFYVRCRFVHAPWWDDFFIVLAMIFAIIGFGLDCEEVHQGKGRHAYYLSPAQVREAAKFESIGQVTVMISAMFSKISICLFLYRLFAVQYKWRVFFYTMIAFIGGTYSVSAIAQLPKCNPVDKIWDPTVPGTCWPVEIRLVVGYAQGGIAVFCDFTLALLPIVFLWDIRIGLKAKLGICTLMGLGIVTGVCAIMRTVLLHDLTAADFTWDVVGITTWAVLECKISIIAATLPTILPLFFRKRYPHPEQQNHEDIRQPGCGPETTIPRAAKTKPCPRISTLRPFSTPETFLHPHQILGLWYPYEIHELDV